MALKLTDIDCFVVLVASPLVGTALSLNVSLDVAKLNEGINCSLEHIEVYHFVVTIARYLIQNGSAQTILNIIEAMISEQMQGCCGEGSCVVVL